MEGLKTQIEILKQLCMFAIFTETKRKSAFLPLLLSEALSGSEMMIPLCDGWVRQRLLIRGMITRLMLTHAESTCCQPERAWVSEKNLWMAMI